MSTKQSENLPIEPINGFWSYAHADDERSKGRIMQLAKDLQNEYELLTGEPLKLFFDKLTIKWGDKWRLKIDDAIGAGNFFIPILTPTFFQRAECRRELQAFMEQAEAKGAKSLVLPILWVDVKALHEKNPTDEFVRLLQIIQWEPWQELRLVATESEGYLQAVHRLASRLVEAKEEIEKAELAVPARPEMEGVEQEEEPGELDKLAQLELMPEWNQTINELGEKITFIGELFKEGTKAVQKSSNGSFMDRLKIFKELTRELTEPADEIEQLSQKYAAQLSNIDAGIYTLIGYLPTWIEADGETKERALGFIASTRELVQNARKSAATTEEMLKSFAPIERQSKDIRVPLRTLRRGLTLVIQGRETIQGWSDAIDKLSFGETNLTATK
ncbi:MAG TPA: toll/interleukin-1 receptor domain-containing protein [Candidatus Saccharimonadales bacterium]